MIVPFFLSIFFSHLAYAQQNLITASAPLDVAKKIGDKLIRDTPFKYRLTLPKANKKFDGLHFVDFARTFGVWRSAIAYAYTTVTVNQDQEFDVELVHNDRCKIWVNGSLVYEKSGPREVAVKFDERSVELTEKLTLHLNEGRNDVLIKSETKGNDWVVYLQPPSLKGAVVTSSLDYPIIGLSQVKHIDSGIGELSNWLVIGPFSSSSVDGMDTVFGPEKEIVFGVMYDGLNGQVTWTIPKTEVLGDLIDPLPWGTNYTWNYHNGGVAWAMQHLYEVSGEEKYNDFANHFCDFHIKGAPFVDYQVNVLRAVTSANYGFLFSPLLDFTLAPSLPFIYRLRKEGEFQNRGGYEQHINRILKYAKEEQVRLPGDNIYTRLTPEKYTTWVDDMFMGIPLLVQASHYVTASADKTAYLEDAVNQVISFNNQVWDSTANLYMHGRYSTRKDVKTPYWARANGWGIWATTEVLEALPKNHPQYPTILGNYIKHVDALVALQFANGLWRNVLNRRDSPEEVSGTAIFVMAIARGIRHGWIDGKVYLNAAVKGWEAITSQVEDDGTVHKICVGTMLSEDVEYYINRPFYDNDTHGLFAVLFAGIEMHKLLCGE